MWAGHGAAFQALFSLPEQDSARRRLCGGDATTIPLAPTAASERQIGVAYVVMAGEQWRRHPLGQAVPLLGSISKNVTDPAADNGTSPELGSASA